MSEDDALSEPFRFADVAFREFAEMTAANDGATFEEAHPATWKLYELGHLKLVGEGDRLHVRACITRAERRAVAKQNRPLAASWRRSVIAARGGTERVQGGRLEPNSPSNLIEVGPVGSSNDPPIAVGDMALAHDGNTSGSEFYFHLGTRRDL